MRNGAILSGVVEVSEPEEKAYEVKVTLGTSSRVRLAANPAPPTPGAAGVVFTTLRCLTPVVTAVSVAEGSGLSGHQVTPGATLTIKGSNLGSSPCQTKVTLGPGSCEVTAAKEDVLSCVLREVSDMVSLVPTPVTVVVSGRGIATLDTSGRESLLTLMPSITSVSPREGSVGGGTLVTIKGTGLRALDAVVKVELGQSPCRVVNLTSTVVTCITSPVAAPGTVTLALFVSSGMVPALSEAVNTFSFAETATPSVRSAGVSSGRLVINGSDFGSESSRVSVTLTRISAARRRRSLEALATEEEGLGSGDASELFGADFESSSDFWKSVTGTHTASFEEIAARGAWRVAGSARTKEGERTSRIKRQTREDEVTSQKCKIILLSDTSIVCDTSLVAAGHYEVSVGVEGVGNALTHEDAALVTLVPLVDSVTPGQGSVHGESLLTITGAGFSPEDVAVAVGGVACPLESQSVTSLTCRSPVHAEGLVDVVVTSAGLDASAASKYAYTVAKTPVLRRVKLQKGRTLRVEGEGLSPSGDAPEVLVGGVACPVISHDNNYITCHGPQYSNYCIMKKRFEMMVTSIRIRSHWSPDADLRQEDREEERVRTWWCGESCLTPSSARVTEKRAPRDMTHKEGFVYQFEGED
ncbi:hypothetical protein C7M84_005368 [Penaeus vannamei]|uniref:IPT/TIG domain-containing protein n=1 Tax=Penaeus vannamei TaxID=6689 RepID=A0A3R7M8S4_PENVA|nr:hypothetical protein C7M84_005368 [Penaeus vannamei]